MRLSGEVDDCPDPVGLKEIFNEAGVGDVAVHELAPHRIKIRQVVEVPRIGERVKDNYPVLRIFIKPVVGEVGADEACPASNHYGSHRHSLIEINCVPERHSGEILLREQRLDSFRNWPLNADLRIVPSDGVLG